MSEEIVLHTLATPPHRTNALHFHHSTRFGGEIAATMPGYQHRPVLETLISPRGAAALINHGITRIGFRDLG